MAHRPAVLLCRILPLGLLPAFSQSTPTAGAPAVAKEVRDNFVDVDRRLLEMAKDWPADKYDYKLKPEMRSFGAVLVHVAAGVAGRKVQRANVPAVKVQGQVHNMEWAPLLK